MINNKINIVFMGTTIFSSKILENLILNDDINVVAAYTMPDAIRKRGKKLTESPVKTIAKLNKIDVLCPTSFKNYEEIDKLKNYNPDFICVAAYGIIVPESILKIPKYCCLNVHGSLLPSWRGAAPLQRSILNNDKYTGTSIMRMEKGMDTGDWCIQSKFLLDNMYLNDVENLMVKNGSKDLIVAMKQIIKNKIRWNTQDEKLATYADKIEKNELWLSTKDTSLSALNKIRASSSEHPCKCRLANKNVTILKAKKCKEDINLKEKELCYINKKLFIGFKDNQIEILNVLPDNKKTMDAKSFATGIQNIKNNILNWSEIS